MGYDDKHGHSDEKMTADEKHISKLAGDMKYDKRHHGSPAKHDAPSGRSHIHTKYHTSYEGDATFPKDKAKGLKVSKGDHGPVKTKTKKSKAPTQMHCTGKRKKKLIKCLTEKHPLKWDTKILLWK